MADDNAEAGNVRALAPALNERQLLFCEEYLVNPNGTRAAVAAGYSPKSARQHAHRMLKNDDILQKIAELRHELRLEYRVSRDSLLDRAEHIMHTALNLGRPGAALQAVALQAKLAGLVGKTAEIEARARAAHETRMRLREERLREADLERLYHPEEDAA